jgi:hypothetical protein
MRLEENDRKKMMGLRGRHFVGSMEIAIPGGRPAVHGCKDVFAGAVFQVWPTTILRIFF